PMTPADEAADAFGLLDALGVERAHVAGHSIGTAYVLEMAAAAPERLHTLILLDPATVPSLGVPDPVLAAMDGLDPSLLQTTSVEEAIGAFESLILGDDWRDFFDASPGGLAQAVADFDRAPPNMEPWTPLGRAEIEAIDMPALVLW